MKLLAKFILILLPVFSQAQIVVDGNISVSDLSYYRQLSTANANNGFGNGNDLGALYYFSNSTTLFIGITGTVENNTFNNIVFFIDNVSYAGRGTGTLGGGSGGIGVFAYPATCLGPSKLDAGFDADFAFAFNKGNTNTNMFFDAMRFGTNAGDEYFQYGNVGSCPLNGTMVSQTIPFCDLRGSCTPSVNVDYAFLEGFLPAPNPAQFNGIEFAIPYTGLPGFSVGHHLRFFVLITNQNGYGSNECIPGDPNIIGDPGPASNLQCGFDLSTVSNPGNDIFYTIPDVVLPLSFVSTTAKLQNKMANIEWSVVQDVEALSYIVERSANGTTYTSIGSVLSQLNKDIANYSFTDNTTPAGKSYYRIKAVCRNSAPKFSRVVMVENDKGTFFVYPNPAEGRELTLHTGKLNAGLYQFSLWNTAGQPVYKTILQLPAPGTAKKVALPQHLPAGTYCVHLQAGNSSYSEPLILMAK